MLTHYGQRYGVEFKFSEAPEPTHSMRTAIADLQLKHLWIVYPGSKAFPMDRNISAWPLQDILKLRKSMAQ